MPKMTIMVPHSLAQEEALARIKTLLGDLKQRHGDLITDVTEEWDGNRARFSFKTMGFATAGTLIVTPAVAELSGSLPFAALPFKGRIEREIRTRAEELLS